MAGPEDDGDDIKAFTDFMCCTKAPPRGPITPDINAREALFNDIGRGICHTTSITVTTTTTTTTADTFINGGSFIAPGSTG